MNQSDRTIPYAIAGIGVLALLVVLSWLALRATPTEQPAKAVSASSRERHHVTPLYPPVDEPRSEEAASPDLETVETNAARIYRQAFALYEALSEEQKGIVRNWRTNVDASVEAELCEKIQPICNLMYLAAVLTNCDWGIEQPVTFKTPLRYLSQSRSIARAAVWSATHCRASDPAGAVDDVVATSHLGQNLSAGLIGHLVNLAIQGLVIDAVTGQASTLAKAREARLDQLFTDARSEEGLYRAIKQEAGKLSASANQLAATPRAELMRELKELAHENSGLESIDPDQAIGQIGQAADLAKQHAQMLGASDAEYREWLASVQAARKTNPLAELFLSPLDQVTELTRAFMVRSAMAAAGLAVICDGTGALQSHVDPATGQPFVYTETADGFDLQSNSSCQINGKPLKLSFK